MPIQTTARATTLALAGLTALALGACDDDDPGSTAPTVSEPTRLAFAAQPSDAEGRVALDPAPEVEVLDEDGDRVTDYSGTVELALASDPTGGSADLRGTTSVEVTDGVASFADVHVAFPAEGYTLEATSGELDAATSDAFDVGLTFLEVSAGVGTTCGLTEPGHVYCWGDLPGGEDVAQYPEDHPSPYPMPAGATFDEVSAGYNVACALEGSGAAWCWGIPDATMLGAGDDPSDEMPVEVAGDHVFATVHAGTNYACALDEDARAWCWGANVHGNLGDGTSTDRATPAEVTGGHDWSSVRTAVYDEHTCGVTTSRDAYCWGEGGDGQLGRGVVTDRFTPHPDPAAVEGDHEFTVVAGGDSHTCALTSSGDAWCWGAGQTLGDGTNADTATPVAVAQSVPYSALDAGRDHTCVLTPDDTRCWGMNFHGSLGDGTEDAAFEPIVAAGGEAFVQISAGDSFTCAVDADGDAWCWGWNREGQLGDGTTADRMNPVRVGS